MTEPTVCCIMLTQDRPELAKRAVECFRTQTYLNKALLVWDTSTEMKPAKRLDVWQFAPDIQHEFYGPQDYAIGALRNHAIQYGTSEVVCTVGVNKELTGPADIIVHFDDDDWSHPNRIAEQVALLQSSGADVVGYNEMLFWREAQAGAPGSIGQAWLYSGPTPRQALGASLCYWRKTWEARLFNPQLPRKEKGGGEDWDFLRDRKIEVATALPQSGPARSEGHFAIVPCEPRMIARIHGGNHSNGYDGIESSAQWKHVPEWDDKVREILRWDGKKAGNV